MLFLAMLLCLGCQTTEIPNVRFYAEIPFQDCPEGVWVESVTRKSGLISCADWEKQRPFMIMIDPEGKREVFRQWSKACRYAGKKCNVELDTVKDTIDQLDGIAERILKP